MTKKEEIKRQTTYIIQIIETNKNGISFPDKVKCYWKTKKRNQQKQIYATLTWHHHKHC